jgi:predicted nucleotidyltransferase
MDRWVEVAERRRREIAAAVAALIKEACRVGDVVLFGSRARGDFHDMSDWDLAVVTQDREYAVRTVEFGQVVYIPLAKLHQLLDFSMLILDVAYEGLLLRGRGEFWQEFAREVMQYVRERRLGKNRWGWYPVKTAGSKTPAYNATMRSINAPMSASIATAAVNILISRLQLTSPMARGVNMPTATTPPQNAGASGP